MSDFIRKITGIGATDNVNYIPVVYYCICDTNADTLAKTAKWVGKSDGNTVNGAIKLYKGLVVAVLFVNGFGESNSSSGNIYTLNIDGTGAKQMLLQGSSDNKLTFIEPNTAVVFLYDGSNYRVANGVTGAQLVELQEEIMGSLEDIKEGKVDLKELDGGGYAAATGNVDQPIYISDKHVEAIVDTFGSATNPIWLNEGHFTASTETVGSYSEPIYMSSGVLTKSAGQVGEQVNAEGQNQDVHGPAFKPIWMSGGQLSGAAVSIGTGSNPVHMENGYILPSTETIGAGNATAMTPIWMNAGTLTAATATIGGDVKPLKMNKGRLQAVSANLATEQALADEINRATGAEQDLQGAVDAAAHGINLTSDNNDYKYTFQLKDKNNNLIGNSVTINLPLETVVTGGSYADGIISLTLKNGEAITFPVVDIQNGLVKDSGGNGEGDNNHPIYVNSNGVAISTTYNLADFATTAAVQSGYKPKQTAVSDPTASGDATEFIASISQDANGVITVTKKNVSLPGSFTPSAHNHSASDITSGILSVARGGTGLSTNPSLLTNLGSTTAATVFQASPRPGITGTLGIGNGGTGATTAAAARTNLGLGTAATHAHGDYAVAGHTHAVATSSTPGFMPKLSGNASQYLNGAGNWVSITDNNYYHTAGNYTLAASSGSSALKATIGGTGVNAITLSVPVYWGSATPTGTSTTGAIYIQIQ